MYKDEPMKNEHTISDNLLLNYSSATYLSLKNINQII